MDTHGLLKHDMHRPFPLPARPWKYFQDWQGVLFLHYRIEPSILASLVPEGLALDFYDGDAWISLVMFTVKDLRPQWLPPLPYASEFHETNLRTYVVRNGVPGIYFLSVEASKNISVLIARTLARIHYRKASIHREPNQYYHESRRGRKLDLRYCWLEDLKATNLDNWLTERYCAYEPDAGNIYRYNIHHKKWKLKKMKLSRCRIDFNRGDIQIKARPELCHYSHNQPVLFWGREKC